MTEKQRSPIDELFFDLYGFYPTKAGKAFEILSAAAVKLITGKQVKYDQYVKGTFSDTTYQLDGEIISDEEKEMLEAKDYTILDRKVGRGDVQKLSGALDIDRGILASATDFTKPAAKYAKSSSTNPNQKQIELYHIRPSVESDEKGRIKKLVFKIHVAVPNFEKGQYQFEWTEDAIQKFEKRDLLHKEITMSLSEFYDINGNIVLTLMDFTKNNQPEHKKFEDEFAIGAWNLLGYYIKIADDFFGINKINYKVPYDKGVSELIIENEGTPKILIKSFDGKTNKLLTDKQFKDLTLDDNEIK